MADEIVVTIPDSTTEDDVTEVVETLAELVEESLETVETVVEELTETITEIVEDSTDAVAESVGNNDSDSALILAAVAALGDRIASVEQRLTVETVEDTAEDLVDSVTDSVVIDDVPPPSFKGKVRKFWFGE